MRPYDPNDLLAAYYPSGMLNKGVEHCKGFWTKANLLRSKKETSVITIKMQRERGHSGMVSITVATVLQRKSNANRTQIHFLKRIYSDYKGYSDYL